MSKDPHNILNINRIDLSDCPILDNRTEPFHHFIVAPVLAENHALDVLSYLEVLSWQLEYDQLYKFYIPLAISPVEELTSFLLDLPEIRSMASLIQENLGRSISPDPLVDFHKYTVGCGIGMHTDSQIGEARFVLNLNRQWNEADQGVWLLASNPVFSDNIRYLPPLHNTGFCFATAENSYHALANRTARASYAVVFRFYLIR